MKKLWSLILIITLIITTSTGVYALPKSFEKNAADGFLEVLNKAHAVAEEHKMFNYVRFVDVNGDGIEEMIAICEGDRTGAAVACYLFSYRENGVGEYEFFNEIYFDNNMFKVGAVDVFLNSGDFIVRDSTYLDGYGAAFLPPHTVAYNELSVDEEGAFVQGICGAYFEEGGYESEDVYIPASDKSEKQAEISRWEKGEKINIFSLEKQDDYGCPELVVGDGYMSRQQAIDYIKQKRADSVAEAYSAFLDVTDTYSDEDADKISKLLKCFSVSERKIYALMSEDELISLTYEILSCNLADELISPENTYPINAGGCIEVYDTDKVENLMYTLTGCMVDYRNHTCTTDNCPVVNQSIDTWEEVDSETLRKVESRDLTVIYTSEIGEYAEIEIKNIYELSADRVLVLYEYNEDKSIYTYAILGKRMYNGKNEFYMIEQGGKSIADAEYLSGYAVLSREPSNIDIDYGRIKDYADSGKCVEYIRSLTESGALNDSAKEELAEYIEYVLKNSCGVVIEAKGKKVNVTADNILSELERAEKLYSEIGDVLSENGVILNKNVEIPLKVDTKGVSLKKGVTVVFDKTLRELAERFGSIEVICDEKKQSVCVDSENLTDMLDKNYTSVRLQTEDEKYRIQFLDDKGGEVSRGAAKMTFSFEADNEYCSVFYENGDKKELQGGISDIANKLIRFMTLYSGMYYVGENIPEISDIDNLTDEEKEAVLFMVSRGYMTLEDGRFNPYGSLTRYDFTRILVGIFYAIDYDAVCDFSDVEKDNPYYTYVASSQSADIVKGFEDNTFKGYKNASNEEVISVVARTLADKKDYAYPENTDEYIQFVDDENITDWENQRGEIALSVREGLIERGGILAPRANITRVRTAVILYRLFKLLYGDSPASTATSTVSGGERGLAQPIALASICILVVLGAAVLIIKKRKSNIIKSQE